MKGVCEDRKGKNEAVRQEKDVGFQLWGMRSREHVWWMERRVGMRCVS